MQEITNSKTGQTKLHKINETRPMGSNMSENISDIISNTTDLKDQLRNMSSENFNTFSDYIDE